jgi:Endonuclease/Exonuclease/phosphatase family
MRFLSYNIQLDGLDVPGHYWNDRKLAVFEMIESCDIIGLQEVTNRQFTEIVARFPTYQWIGVNTVTGQNLLTPAPSDAEGLAIGWKCDLMTVIGTPEFKWFSETPKVPSRYARTTFNKGFQHLVLRLSEPYRLSQRNFPSELHILNSHFPHDDIYDPNPRLLSARQEFALLERLRLAKESWISCGDRNFVFPRDLEAYFLYNVTGYGYYDTSPRARIKSGVNTTFIGYENHPKCNPILRDAMTPTHPNVTSDDPLFSYFEHSTQLDVVMSNLSPIGWCSDPCEYNQEGHLLPIGPVRSDQRRFASDHCAIIVTF